MLRERDRDGDRYCGDGWECGLGTNTAGMAGDGHYNCPRAAFQRALASRQYKLVMHTSRSGLDLLKCGWGEPQPHPPVPVFPSINQSINHFIRSIKAVTCTTCTGNDSTDQGS